MTGEFQANRGNEVPFGSGLRGTSFLYSGGGAGVGILTGTGVGGRNG